LQCPCLHSAQRVLGARFAASSYQAISPWLKHRVSSSKQTLLIVLLFAVFLMPDNHPQVTPLEVVVVLSTTHCEPNCTGHADGAQQGRRGVGGFGAGRAQHAATSSNDRQPTGQQQQPSKSVKKQGGMAGMALGLWRAASDQLLDLEAKIMQQVNFLWNRGKLNPLSRLNPLFLNHGLVFRSKTELHRCKTPNSSS